MLPNGPCPVSPTAPWSTARSRVERFARSMPPRPSPRPASLWWSRTRTRPGSGPIRRQAADFPLTGEGGLGEVRQPLQDAAIHYGGQSIAVVVCGVYDCDRLINPTIARSQLMDWMLFGLGAALCEETVFDSNTGCLWSGNMADYHIPACADAPQISIEVLNIPDPHAGALRAHGSARWAPMACRRRSATRSTMYRQASPLAALRSRQADRGMSNGKQRYDAPSRQWSGPPAAA